MSLVTQSSSVFKILVPEHWALFQQTGRYEGSDHDKRDGFIHLCTREQLPRVLERYYKNYPEVVVVEFSGEAFLKQLKWEPASDGDLYPHLYGCLNFEAHVGHQKRTLTCV